MAVEHTLLLNKRRGRKVQGRSMARMSMEPTRGVRRQHHRLNRPLVFDLGTLVRIRVLTVREKRNMYCQVLHTSSFGNRFGFVQLKYLLSSCRDPCAGCGILLCFHHQTLLLT